MALRKRQKQRLLILAGVLIVGAGVAFGAYRWRQASRDAEARDWRDKGLAALQAGKFEEALGGIGRFLGRLGDEEATAGDYAAYARARRRVPAPNSGHLADAISAYQRALELAPADREIQQELLDLYRQVGFATEARALLDQMLAATPDDLELLAQRCAVLEAVGEVEAAAREAEALNARSPADLSGYLRTARLWIRLDYPLGRLQELADKAVAANAGDRSFELVRAYALSRAAEQRGGDATLMDAAVASLDAVLASESAMTDPVAVKILAGLLESVGRADDAFRTLETASETNDARLRTEYVRRLVYRSRGREVPDVVAGWRAGGGEVSPEVAAFEAFGLKGLDREPEARQIATDLLASADEDARAWGALIEFVPTVPEGRQLEAVEAFQQAARITPDSAFVREQLGSLVAAGDADLAREHWLAAAELARTWGEPLRRVAASLLGTERAQQAAVYARQALERSAGTPGSVAAAATLADALVASSASMSEGGRAELQKWLSSIRENEAGALAQHFGTLEIALLAESEPDAAADRLGDLLASEPDATEATFLRLAQIAETTGSGQAEQFLDASEAAHGLSPRLAFARGLSRARRGQAEAGLSRFDADRQRADATFPPLEWDFARAALLDRLSDPDAGPTWIALAEANPESLPAQMGCLSSPRAWRYREAMEKVIDRVEALTGDGGAAWRLARGRWLLDTPDANEETLTRAVGVLSEAARITPRSVEAHLLLARALARVGKSLDRAEDEFRMAAELSPDNAGIQLELARIAARQGRSAEARAVLERTLRGGDLSTDQLVRAAMLLAAQGEYGESADVLSRRVSLDDAPREGVLVLASLYGRLGEYERALALCDRLMERPELDVLEMAANLNASLGRTDEAGRLLDRLESVPGASPLDIAMVRSRYAAHWGSKDAALAAYRAALGAAPDDPRAWWNMLDFVIPRGDRDELARLLDDSRADGIEAIQFLRAHRDVVLKALGDARLQDVILEAIAKPDARTPLMIAVAAVVAAGESRAPAAPLAQSVLKQADENRDAISLQLLAAELSLRGGDPTTAIDVARRTAERFPRAVAPARQLAVYLGATKRWPEAVNAGLDWREREGGTNLTTEAFVGDAMLNAGRAGDALALFQAKSEAALADPDTNWVYVATHAVALVRTGLADDARTMLAPLVGRCPKLYRGLVAIRAEQLGSAKSCVRWLELLEGLIPASDSATQLAIAHTWGEGFETYGGEELRSGALARAAKQTEAPDATADAFFIAGVLKADCDDDAGAEQAYRRAIELDPKHVPARNNLALLLARTGRAPEAVEIARRILADVPGNPRVLDTYGVALRLDGKAAEARKQFEAALTRSTSDTSIMLNLAETLQELGDARELSALLVRITELEGQAPKLDESEQARLKVLREPPR